GRPAGVNPKGRGTQGPWAALRRWPARPVRAARRALPRALGHPGAGAIHIFTGSEGLRAMRVTDRGSRGRR
ncbi:MAG: hypothetical protein ACK5V0_03930, partial [Alphaproteobacteria bacterium]